MCRLLCFPDEIALFVGVCRSWQHYRLRHGIVCRHRTLTIQGELPGAAEVDVFRLILCLNVQAEDSH